MNRPRALPACRTNSRSCSRCAACSTFCSSSIRDRWSASPAPPPIRCSDASSFRGCGGGLSPSRSRNGSVDQCRSAGAGARRRARTAVDHGAAADCGPRPARQRNGSRRRAICTPRCCCTIRRRRNMRRNCHLLRRSPCMMRSANARRHYATRSKLKWPNDLLVSGAKVAGILIESERVDEELTVVIGIGVNCRHHPADTPYPATDLARLAPIFRLKVCLQRYPARWWNGWRNGITAPALRPFAPTGWPVPPGSAAICGYAA